MLFRKISGSLSLKIILLLNAFLILPAILILIFFNTKVTTSIADEIKKSLVTVTDEKLNKLDLKLDSMEQMAQSIASQPYIKDYFAGLDQGQAPDQNKLRRIAAVLEDEIQRGNGIYENMLYYYKQTAVVDGIGGKSVGKTNKQKERLMGLIKISPATGRPVMVNYIPFSDNAMFVMSIELNNITGKIIDSGHDKLMQSLIIDEDGLVVASPRQDQIMKLNFNQAGDAAARFFATVKSDGLGSGFLTLDGQKYIAAFAKDPNRPLYLVSYTPISQYTRQSVELTVGLLILLLVCIGAGLFISFFMSQRLIRRPIQNLTAATEKMALGDCDVRVVVKSRDEIGTLAIAFNTMVENVREGAVAAERIASGELDVQLPVRSENDLLNKNLNGMITHIQALVADINMLAEGATAGDLAVRADESKHSGDFRQIVAGINRTLEAIIRPLDDGIQILQKMALNDYTLLLEPQKYRGKLCQFATEINTVVSRILSVQDAYIRLSKGDISRLDDIAKIGKRSENDHLTPAGIATMQNIKNLIDEVARLTQAAVVGDLKARGDAAQFEGGYHQIISGLNQTLDAIVAPIHEASAVLQKMAQGNLNVQASEAYQGDYAVLAQAVNDSIGSFNQMLGEINNAAEQVAAGAGQIAAASENLSQATTEQAATMEEINASVNEIADQTKQNALHADRANQLSLTTKDNAVNGNSRMTDMLQAMEEINGSSATISKIIKVIDEIAFQTNILALNAAVEAARAGQHGKGFAVVAEEVRNLAARSADAAKETTLMIEASIQKVSAGTKIAHETAESLGKIVDSVNQAADLMFEIAVASKEQAAGIVLINQGIDQVSRVTQTSTATAEESSAASEELTSQAEMLKQMVQQFVLKNTTHHPAKAERPGKTSQNSGNSSLIKQIRLDDGAFGKY